MKKTFFFIFSFLITFAGSIAAQASLPLKQAVQRAAENLEAHLKNGTTVAVLSFAAPTEAFSVYVLDELTAALVNRKKLMVLDRKNLDVVRQEQNFGLSGEADDEAAIRIGHFLGAQAVVTGRLNRIGGAYRMVIQAINAETSAVEASYSSDIAADDHVARLLEGSAPEPPPASPREQGLATFSADEFGGVWTAVVSYAANGMSYRDAYTIELYEDGACWVFVRDADGAMQTGEGYWSAENGVFHLDCDFTGPSIPRLESIRWMSRYALQNNNRRLRINVKPAPNVSGVAGVILNKGK
ncbi:MAG: CsgG/HfaB family protein [Treponema sp.]|jgi:TolB-like protein|nr:CsgG/HfaB family protein [Treponema sp.]